MRRSMRHGTVNAMALAAALALIALGGPLTAGCKGKDADKAAAKPAAPQTTQQPRYSTGRPALPTPSPYDEPPPGGTPQPVEPHDEQIAGITMSFTANGQVRVTGSGRDGTEVGMVFDNETMLRNALPTLSGSLTDEQLGALSERLVPQGGEQPAAGAGADPNRAP